MSAWKQVLVLGVLAASVTMLVSAGAFSTVSAERSADISVVGDSQGLVQLVPYSSPDGQQSQFASLVDGQLQVGVNVQSEVDARNVFNVTNHGTQSVAVWIVDIDNPEEVAEGTDENNTNSITFYNPEFGGAGSMENGVASIEGRENAVELGIGETLTVSLYIETESIDSAEIDLLDEILIYADANVEGATGSNDDSDDDPSDGDGDQGLGSGGHPDIHPMPNQKLTIPTSASPRTLRIGNKGDDTLEVTDLRIVGADAEEFAIVSGDAPFTLQAGNGVNPTHSVSIAYTGNGHATAQLEIVSNDPDEPVRVVRLKGTGSGNSGGND